MPTYQYACTECGTPLEVVQSFSDPALTECPTCGGRLRKVFSAVGVVFKGSGFYRTDSRNDPAKSKANGKPKIDSAGSDKSDSATKESSKTGSDASAPAAKSDPTGTTPKTPLPGKTPAASSTKISPAS